MDEKTRIGRGSESRRVIHHLRSLCAEWDRDIKFIEDGGSLYFAVDYDVVDMYLRPEANAQYGEVLGRDSGSGQLVARLLGDSIFLSNSLPGSTDSRNAHPLLVLPPHDQELLYGLWKIARRVQSGVGTVSALKFQALSSAFEQYRNERSGPNADIPEATNNLLKRIEDHVPELVALFDEAEGDAAALKRFSRINAEKFVNIFNLKRDNGAFFIGCSEEEFRDTISDLVNAWEVRLQPYAFWAQTREALTADSRVLAAVQYINKTFCGPKERLVLITGSRYLFKAMDSSDRRRLPIQECNFRRRFMSSFLRRPQWIMSSRRFFRTNSEEDTVPRFSDIGRPWIERPLGLERLLELMAPLDGGSSVGGNQDADEHAKAFAQVQESWNAEIKALAAAKYGSGLEKAKTLGATKLAAIITELQRNGNWSLSSFKKRLSDNALQLQNTLFLDSSSLGLLDILAEPTRMVPALCFDTPFEEFNKLLKELLEKMIGKSRRRFSKQSSETQNLIAQVNRDSDGNDRDPYHVHILHAAAFAARGHWRQVLTLCDNAIRIANGLLEEARYHSEAFEEREYRRGREAAYLAAIARRRSARGFSDLDLAQRYLELAIERVNKGESSILRLRFESEGLAISIRRAYFKFFSDDKELSQEQRENLCKSIESFMDSLKSIIERARGERGSVEWRRSERDIADWILRQCYTNYFDLALIRSELQTVPIRHFGLEKECKEFRDSISPKDEIRDHHAWLVSKVVGVLFNVDEQEADVLENISITKKDNKPMPYETRRLELYQRLINEHTNTHKREETKR